MFKISLDKKELAFAILIGGKSKRFGSDKGLYEYNDFPLISHQLKIISSLNRDIFIVAHSQTQIQKYVDKIDYRKILGFILDENILSNKKTDVRSPLIGIYSAFKELNKLNYQNLFILSCDMPFIEKEVVKLLIKESKGFDCCIPRWENGYLEPLFAIYSIKKGLKKARFNLKKKTYKLIELIDKNWKIKYVSIEDRIKKIDKNLSTFRNINRPEDLNYNENICID